MKFCERLKTLLNENGVSHQKLADKMCVNRTHVSNWVNGRSLTSVTVLVQLADFFNTSTDYLLGRTDDPGPPTPPVEEEMPF